MRTNLLRSSTAGVLLALLALVALGACGSDDDTTTGTTVPPGGPPDLDGRAFLSEAVTEDGAPRPLVEHTRIRLDFRDGQIGASAGCNSMGGPYRIDGGVLVVAEGLSTTEMGCAPELHDQDEWLAAFLTSRPEVALDGDRLVLSTPSTEVVLVDREVADPDRPLTGTTWTLDTIIEGDAASSVPEGVTATLTISDDGTVALNTGCNSGGGTAEIGDATITFGQIATTLRACLPEVMAVEEAVVAVVQEGEVAYEIEAGRLTLTAGDRGLGFTAR
jgi:heat shock protein HslJ